MHQKLSVKESISKIYRDIGQIFFATIFISPLFNQDIINWTTTIEGLILSLLFWFLSIAMIKQITSYE